MCESVYIFENVNVIFIVTAFIIILVRPIIDSLVYFVYFLTNSNVVVLLRRPWFSGNALD